MTDDTAQRNAAAAAREWLNNHTLLDEPDGACDDLTALILQREAAARAAAEAELSERWSHAVATCDKLRAEVAAQQALAEHNAEACDIAIAERDALRAAGEKLAEAIVTVFPARHEREAVLQVALTAWRTLGDSEVKP